MFPSDFYLSYSKLSALAKGVHIYKNKYILGKKDEDTKSLIKGTGVDLLIDNNYTDYYDKFAILEPHIKIPSSSTKIYDFIKYTMMYNKDYSDLNECYELAYSKLQEENDGKKLRDSLDKFKNEFNDTYKDYYEFLLNSKNKIVISPEENIKHSKISSYFKFSPYCKYYFPENAPADSTEHNMYKNSELEVLPKLKVESELFGLPVKLEYDRVIINHVTKTVTPVDYKTTSFSNIYFEDSYYKYNYYIQNTIYSLVLSQLYSGYNTDTTRFLVVNTEYPTNAVVHYWNWDHVNNNINNDIIVYKYQQLPTVKKLVEDLKFYYENGWDVRREIIENNGHFAW